jgi:hypothetical protein
MVQNLRYEFPTESVVRAMYIPDPPRMTEPLNFSTFPEIGP